MKRLFFISGLILLTIFGHESLAQLTKQEKKNWKKKKKDISLEEFKALVEENPLLKRENNNLKSQVETLESSLNEKDEQMASVQREVSNLRSELVQMKEQQRASALISASSGGTSEQGVVFKVQIGAYEGVDLTSYDEGTSSDMTSETSGELNKYTLGSFRNYWEADKFKKVVRKMGLKDAWIVSYKDGTRVPLKDVLEGIVN